MTVAKSDIDDCEWPTAQQDAFIASIRSVLRNAMNRRLSFAQDSVYNDPKYERGYHDALQDLCDLERIPPSVTVALVRRCCS